MSIVARVSAIEGWLTDEEIRLLFSLAQRGGTVVEIGSYRGRSTVVLAEGIRAAGQGVVWAIDPHEGVAFFTPGHVFSGADNAAFMRNVAPVGDVVRVINLPSGIVGRWWSLPVDLLWIDGDHTEQGARLDWDVWTPHLREGGIVALHDTTTHPGVIALAEWVQSAGGWEQVGAAGSIKAYRRVD